MGGARSSVDLRKSLNASARKDVDSTKDSSFGAAAATDDVDLDQEELQGKIQEYLRKLNEILTDYER